MPRRRNKSKRSHRKVNFVLDFCSCKLFINMKKRSGNIEGGFKKGIIPKMRETFD